jgi:hypothetical protein
LTYGVGEREGGVGLGLGVGEAKAQDDDINATSEIANRSMNKLR